MSERMTLNISGRREASLVNSSLQCDNNMTAWDESMEKMYTYFYLLLFIPGLLLNTIALWVLCRHIRKKTKAVIFMINLAMADLAHILSLPLRIYYYFTHTWPFGRGVCLFCFYLKYLNMYAAIVFLVCISVQRCAFLLNPFLVRRWRRRYDLSISIVVWVVVSLACSPFILMRSSDSSNTTSMSPSSVSSTKAECFKDLPMRPLSYSVMITMIVLAELFGFFIPLACIGFSSACIALSLIQRQTKDQDNSTTPNSSAHSRVQSVTSNCQADKYQEKQKNGEKTRALRMVLSCSALFLFCFAPYHLNFIFYMMVMQKKVSHCGTTWVVLHFHPVSLCMASLSCCLNPLLYYFLTAEFRSHLTIRTSSFSSSLLSSPINSPKPRPAQQRLVSMESSYSDRE
ncbi:putative P2Y purinoceptor 10 [Mastacembelus armatus]|uniref:P2Y receptor family member 10 n=1 Tax=Mastacembelus armatus TaxID=205130 RepID=A0A3Q3MLX5_9TELE|nr:putative P2Y purinoceptor 10 [Mastacembelus armatus]